MTQGALFIPDDDAFGLGRRLAADLHEQFDEGHRLQLEDHGQYQRATCSCGRFSANAADRGDLVMPYQLHVEGRAITLGFRESGFGFMG